MGRSDRIDIVCFHQQQIPFQEFVWHSAAAVWVVFVAIDAAEDGWVAIYDKDTVLEFRVAEAYSLLHYTRISN